MDEQDKNQVTEVIANGILNSLNINGIMEATRAYSMKMAKERVSVMSEEELSETLSKINEAIENSKSSDGTPEASSESTEGTEEVAEAS
tara:strand:+ start:2504 stop:2770 length:267 start_codon:yes stop_codon:yes gene_type:complete